MTHGELNSILAPEEVHRHYVLEGRRLYRKLASGAAKPVIGQNYGVVISVFDGHRLLGADIAWCLIHGNWPTYPIAQVCEDPTDFSAENLFPARLGRVRYVERLVDGLYRHGQSSIGHLTARDCREHWEMLMREHYGKDLPYVLRLEQQERELRAVFVKETALARRAAGLDRPANKKPSRPYRVLGREWHWYRGQWVSTLPACHPADDYRVRCAATLDGVERWEFDAESQRVWAYMPDGSRWRPSRPV